MSRVVPTVLLTGFSPFGGDTTNPSWDAVRALHGRHIAGHRVVARKLPVAFGASLGVLRQTIRETSPRLVLCVGLAGGRAAMSIERVAINIDDARIADNANACPIDTPIVDGGPAAYFATLPIKSMLVALRDAGIPAQVSQTAGTFVCNHVFYGMMHTLRARRRIRAGFVHVPYSPQQAEHHPGAPSFPVEEMTAALRILLRVALTVHVDSPVAAGAES